MLAEIARLWRYRTEYLFWARETVVSWFQPSLRMRVHGSTLPPGVGYTRPQRRLYQRCCRCGTFRILGEFVEMHSFRSWWYSCLHCALADMTNLVERSAPPSKPYGTKVEELGDSFRVWQWSTIPRHSRTASGTTIHLEGAAQMVSGETINIDAGGHHLVWDVEAERWRSVTQIGDPS